MAQAVQAQAVVLCLVAQKLAQEQRLAQVLVLVQAQVPVLV